MKTGGRLPELDGLRGVAILLVVVHHYVYYGFGFDDTSALATCAHVILPLTWSGVDLFLFYRSF